MYAKQYEITLPADYDMGIIRKRVADYGHILDDRAGLALKAYLIRERGVNGSPVNQYAPFYLWNDTAAMGEFLFGGGGFQGIIRDFGRPTVRHWTSVATEPGPARAMPPRTASRRLTTIPSGADPKGMATAAYIQHEIDTLRETARHADVHTAALAVDPHHWQLMRFILWQEAVPETEDATERYEVLHLSQSHLEVVPKGRQW
ncbi:DUF4865 family protein [Actinomadura darangshiensis]|uniref:DUF4865 family protein n=1 Tax=Actinomadura darangshiensis TaxID=705336 RepID=A0A4R5AP62_9ACTN|nr:DUF4865 family protein [Actinomadura darangshiensis]TDD73915.1 DUF4865 family protein [Actinomadura darangshiensis]